VWGHSEKDTIQEKVLTWNLQYRHTSDFTDSRIKFRQEMELNAHTEVSISTNITDGKRCSHVTDLLLTQQIWWGASTRSPTDSQYNVHCWEYMFSILVIRKGFFQAFLPNFSKSCETGYLGRESLGQRLKADNHCRYRLYTSGKFKWFDKSY